jgi:hypothetical protein
MRALLPAAFALLLATGAAFAGASSSNFPPQPNPETKTMSRAQAKVYIAETCAKDWGKSAPGACTCYANRTVDRLNKAEFAHFQEKSYFDDAGREKALRAVDACKLPRPL